MKKINGHLKLLGFRIKKQPTWIIFCISDLVFLGVCLQMLIESKPLFCIGASIVSFAISMYMISLINKVDRQYYNDLNLIRAKYGIKLNIKGIK